MKLLWTQQYAPCSSAADCLVAEACLEVSGSKFCYDECVISEVENTVQLEDSKLDDSCSCNERLCEANERCINDSSLVLPDLQKKGVECLVDCSSTSMNAEECFCGRRNNYLATTSAICANNHICDSNLDSAYCFTYCEVDQMNGQQNAKKCYCNGEIADLTDNVCYNQVAGTNGRTVSSQLLDFCAPGATVTASCYCDGLCVTGNRCSLNEICWCNDNGLGPCQSVEGSCQINEYYASNECNDSTTPCSEEETGVFRGQSVCLCGTRSCLVYFGQACVTDGRSLEKHCLTECNIGLVAGDCACKGGQAAAFAKAGKICYSDGLVSCELNMLLAEKCKCNNVDCAAGRACFQYHGNTERCVDYCDGGTDTEQGCICEKSDWLNANNELFCAENFGNDGKKYFCVNRMSYDEQETPGAYLVCLRECNAGYINTSMPCKCINLISESEQCPSQKYCAGGEIGMDDGVICGIPCGDAEVLSSNEYCVCRSDYTTHSSVCKTSEWCTGMILGNTDNAAYQYMTNNQGNSLCVNELCVDGPVSKDVEYCKLALSAAQPACNYLSYAFRPFEPDSQCIKICNEDRAGMDDFYGYKTGLLSCVCNEDDTAPQFECDANDINDRVYCVQMRLDPGVSDYCLPSHRSECVAGCTNGQLAPGEECKCNRSPLLDKCVQAPSNLYYCAGGQAVTSADAECATPCSDAGPTQEYCVCNTNYADYNSICRQSSDEKYCTNMAPDPHERTVNRPSAAGECVVKCQVGKNSAGLNCRCRDLATYDSCKPNSYCIGNNPMEAGAFVFKYECGDGVATEQGDADENGRLLGCVCNNSNFLQLEQSVCRGDNYCVLMKSNRPDKAAHCVAKCTKGENLGSLACKCEQSRNKPGCPMNYFCIGGDIAVSSVCVPECDSSVSPSSSIGLTSGCLCQDFLTSASSICQAGKYCIEMGGTTEHPVASADAVCVDLCAGGIVRAGGCKCLQSAVSQNCSKDHYCYHPGLSDALCIPPCNDEVAGESGCLCNSHGLICPQGKYCILMGPNSTLSGAGACVDLCPEDGAITAGVCKCGFASSELGCTVNQYCVGEEIGRNAECFEGCGQMQASSYIHNKCLCRENQLDPASLCSNAEYCVDMMYSDGKLQPSGSARCVNACNMGLVSAPFCKCNFNARARSCQKNQYCIGDSHIPSNSTLCVPRLCDTSASDADGCVCNIDYSTPGSVCHAQEFCVNLNEDFTEGEQSQCVSKCEFGLVTDACSCDGDIRKQPCHANHYCSGNEIMLDSKCVLPCQSGAESKGDCECSDRYNSSLSICQQNTYCLDQALSIAATIPLSNNVCYPTCKYNEPGAAGCHCKGYGVCSGQEYCTQLPDLSYKCLNLCAQGEAAEGGCFCRNNTYCEGEQICESTGCLVQICQADTDCKSQSYYCYEKKCISCRNLIPNCLLCTSERCLLIDNQDDTSRDPTLQDCEEGNSVFADGECHLCRSTEMIIENECESALCTQYSDCHSNEYYCANLICRPCSAQMRNCAQCDNAGCYKVVSGGVVRDVTVADCHDGLFFNIGAVNQCRKCGADTFVHENTCVPAACAGGKDCMFSDLYCRGGRCLRCGDMMAGCTLCEHNVCRMKHYAAINSQEQCAQGFHYAGGACIRCEAGQAFTRGNCRKRLMPVYYAVICAAGAIVVALLAWGTARCIKRSRSAKQCCQRRQHREGNELAAGGTDAAQPISTTDELIGQARCFTAPRPARENETVIQNRDFLLTRPGK